MFKSTRENKLPGTELSHHNLEHISFGKTPGIYFTLEHASFSLNDSSLIRAEQSAIVSQP